MKLYFGWAFAWDKREVDLKKGPAKLSLLSTTKDPEPRQVDVIVLTTDADYRPLTKERPRNHAWDVLESLSQVGFYRPGAAGPKAQAGFELPDAWKMRTFRDKGFLYLWNMNLATAADTWLGDKPERVKFPYHIADERVRVRVRKEVRRQGRRADLFRSADRAHLSRRGPGDLCHRRQDGRAVGEAGKRFAKWLDAHPGPQLGHDDELHRPAETRRAGHSNVPEVPRPLCRLDRRRKLGLFRRDAKTMARCDGQGANPAAAGRGLYATDSGRQCRQVSRDLRQGPGHQSLRRRDSLPVGRQYRVPAAVRRLGGAHDWLRIVGRYVVAAADALGVHARRGPAAWQPDGHVSLVQFRRRLDDFLRLVELLSLRRTFWTTITACSPARA